MLEDNINGQAEIKIQVDTTDLTVAPGSSVVIPLTITNQSQSAGNFQLLVEGIFAVSYERCYNVSSERKGLGFCGARGVRLTKGGFSRGGDSSKATFH